MFLVLVAVLSACAVPLCRGRLSRLTDARLRGPALILIALAIQVVIITLLPGGAPLLHKVLHLGTYVLAAAFLWLNRRIAGVLLVAAGTVLNVLAISANGGVMPASRSALRAAGQLVNTKEFLNSTALAYPKLLLLGDVFATPRSWPFANVFSLGDICIALGVAPRSTHCADHGSCRSAGASRRPKMPTVRTCCRPARCRASSSRASGSRSGGRT